MTLTYDGLNVGQSVPTGATWADEALCRSVAHLPAVGAGSPADEENIPALVAAAAQSIEDAIDGVVTPTVFTEYYSGGRPTIDLLRGPIMSVTSITEYVAIQGYPLTIVTDLSDANTAYCATIEPELGIIERRIFGGMPACFFPGRDNVQVVYQAGMSTIPQSLQIGAALLFKYLWDITMPTTSKQRVVSQEIAIGAFASEGLPASVLAAIKAYLPGPATA